MAKAKPKSTITYVMLKDARPLLVEVFGSPDFAGIVLAQWIAEGKVRWRSRGIAGHDGLLEVGMSQKRAADLAQRDLWTGIQLRPKLNWDESSAYKDSIRMDDGERVGFTVYGISVVIQDIEAQLLALDQPESLVEPSPPAKPIEHPSHPDTAATPVNPKTLFDDLCKEHQRGSGEGNSAYAARLYPLMQAAYAAGKVSSLWEETTIIRRLNDTRRSGKL